MVWNRTSIKPSCEPIIILSVGPIGSNFGEILIKIFHFSQGCAIANVVCKWSAICSGLNLLISSYVQYDWQDMHDDVIKWKYFPRYWPFVQGIHRSPVNSPHKGQWRGALRFSLICAWINGRVNNREAGDLRRRRTHYDVNVMTQGFVNVVLYTFVGYVIVLKGHMWCN